MIKQTNLVLSELKQVLEKIDKKKTEKLINKIINAKNIKVIGYGRSGYIGKNFSMRLRHLGLKTGKSLLIVISGSGKTKVTNEIVRSAKTGICLITTNRKSDIAKRSDLVIEIKAKTKVDHKKSIEPLGSLFEQASFIYLDSVVVILMKKLRRSEKFMRKRHSKIE